MDKVIIDNIELTLSHPDHTQVQWIGQEEIMERLLACWLVVAKEDIPLCPRLIGKPGIGKTTLAMSAAQKMNRAVYIYQCTMDTRPEDLIITPVLSEQGKISYHASPVVSAMITGGICILDEGNRMSEKSWASLAPLLDHRRYVESILAGIKVPAHPNFRCCVTMNDDASTYELPDYIMSRLQPMIELCFPPREEELRILKYNIPFTDQTLLTETVNLLQNAHQQDLDCSTRDGIHILRYTMKRLSANSSLAKEQVWKEAVQLILGTTPEKINQPSQTKKSNKTSDLSDFFIDDDYFKKNSSDDDDDKPQSKK